jgi:ribonuclease HII
MYTKTMLQMNTVDKHALKHTIGIDEVGRGPLAGPVAVGVCRITSAQTLVARKQQTKDLRRIFRGVKESKQISEQQREAWFEIMKKARGMGLIDFHVSFQSEKIIDSKGLSYAINTAIQKSLEKIMAAQKSTQEIRPDDCVVLLDGGLRAPVCFTHQKTIIRGDEKKRIIALASIAAKVLRDRRMRAFAKKYPRYGFEIHKGYGTRAHYAALKKHGPCAIHRRSFLI